MRPLPAQIDGAGIGDKIFIQIGGQGANTMSAIGGDGNNIIEQYGGAGNNTMEAKGGKSDDNILIVGGLGNDVITYHCTAGSDIVHLYGGGGDNSLTMNKQGQNLTLLDSTGNTLFSVGTGGTIITIIDVLHIKVIGDTGTVIFQIN